MSFETLIVWFRRDQRINDNTALYNAIHDAKYIIPIYIMDTDDIDHDSRCAHRFAYTLDSLNQLDNAFYQYGSRLIIRTGSPTEILPALMDETNANGVYVNREYEPGIVQQDKRLEERLTTRGKIFRTFKDRVLHEPHEVMNNSQQPYVVFTRYKNAWLSQSINTTVNHIPKHINTPANIKTESLHSIANKLGTASERFHLSAGLSPTSAGEKAAEDALNRFIDTGLPYYKDKRDLLGIDGTSRLSHFIAFGNISIRIIYNKISDAIKENISLTHRDNSESDPALAVNADSFINELIWREFYIQILFHFEVAEKEAFKTAYNRIQWVNDPSMLEAWRQGRTGYPVVDAAMRQLLTEGWMHNRGRMIVSSFLTKDLLCNWQEGEAWFRKHLIDYDLACNNGGWQWSAGTGTDAQPFFRIFNPTEQGKKFDNNGDYVRKYVPELANLPAAFIHAPWMLTESERISYGCGDYPQPIVDHKDSRQQALAVYRAALKNKGS